MKTSYFRSNWTWPALCFLALEVLTGCGAGNKGLDTPINTSSPRDFFESCFKAYSEMKDANPKEFQALKDVGGQVFDFSQPRDQSSWTIAGPYLCQSHAQVIPLAASTDNIALSTYRELFSWEIKSQIDQALKVLDKHNKEFETRSLREHKDFYEHLNSYINDQFEKVKKLQPAYLALSGKSFGPSKIEPPKLYGAPQQSAETLVVQPQVVAESKPIIPTSPEKTKEEPLAGQPTNKLVEQTGLCKGLDLANASEQLECLNRKFTDADKQLNETYKQVMSGLNESRKVLLKKEQIEWIKTKEAKCAQAGKSVEGGNTEVVAIEDCKVKITDQRLAYLKSYK